MAELLVAPDGLGFDDVEISVFLAGGITGCENWQDKVVNYLVDLEHLFNISTDLYIFNPRRDEFDFDDEYEELRQIKWEHDFLNKCDIFSCYFQASESLQPISLYELGKWGTNKASIVTVEKGYKRERDVIFQSMLDGIMVNHCDPEDAAYKHAIGILSLAESIVWMNKNS